MKKFQYLHRGSFPERGPLDGPRDQLDRREYALMARLSASLMGTPRPGKHEVLVPCPRRGAGAPNDIATEANPRIDNIKFDQSEGRFAEGWTRSSDARTASTPLKVNFV